MLAALSSILLAATCSAPLPGAPAVPAPIMFKTSCGGFRLGTDGTLTRLPRGWLAAHVRDNPRRRFGTGLRIERNRAGRITLRSDERVWRSRDLYRNTAGDNAFGPGTFSFSSYYRGVFLTDLARPERLVVPGRALFPLDFFDSGRLIVTGGGAITILSPRGRIERRYGYDAQAGVTFDADANTLFFVTGQRRLAALRESQLHLGRLVGFPGSMWLATPERLLFSAARALTLTDLGGRVIAQARWSRAPLALMDSGATVSPDGRHVALRLSNARPGASKGTAAVYLLSAGQRRARFAYRHRLSYIGCGDAALLMWNGAHVLYRATDGHAAVIDAASGKVRDLTGVLESLPRRPTDQPVVAWASSYLP